MRNVPVAVRLNLRQVFALSNYIVKYSRKDAVKYISHLDFMRMFYRSIRRSGLEMEYSQGFNPHPIMTVAVPMSVGMTADGEYLKVGINTELSDCDVMKIINNSLPDGFEVTKIQKLKTNKEIDFNDIDRAEYVIDTECENPDAFSCDDFMAMQEIVALKKTKSGEKETDIKPLIYSVEKIESLSGNLTLRATMAAGNLQTLKPETLVDAINRNSSCKIGFFMSHRTALKTNKNKELF